MKYKIIATGPLDQIALDLFAPHAEVVVAPDPSEATVNALVADADVMVVRGDSVVTTATLDAAPKLKVIGRCGVGYNNIDIDAATAKRIPVVFTPGAGARAVAEGAIAFMLVLCKHVRYWDTQFKAGNWTSRFNTITGDLEGATLGIVGFGRIGQDVARLARPFDMTLLAHDPYVEPDIAGAHGVKLVALQEIFSMSDFITLHAAVTQSSRGMVTREMLQHVKHGAILVNLARGDLIPDLDAVHEALQDGRLGGVGLDVFYPEPGDHTHPLFEHPNCLTSPHAIGMSKGAMNRIFTWMCRDVIAVLQGQRPEHVVNPRVFA